MALGRRSPKEPELFISHHALAESPGHPFYRKLNAVLAEAGFDHWVEKLCAESYADGVGRPGIPPGVYFRMLFVGYFEGLGSDRAIAWRCADSLSLREFLGLSLSERTPEHSSMTRIRQRLTKEIHEKVFVFILGMLEKKGLVKGRRVAIDATTIEANAAMRHIERRDDGRSYNEYLSDLAREAGIEEPTKADRVKVDRKRKKTCSNKEWRPTHDPDARITKMKDGRTRAAYKPEHVVDLETQALLATEVQPADASDTATMVETLRKAQAARAGPDRRGRGRQGIPQDRGLEGTDGRLAGSHVRAGAGLAEASSVGQELGEVTTGGLFESPARATSSRAKAPATTWRGGRAELRARVRHGRTETDDASRTRDGVETVRDLRRCVQPGAPDAQARRRRKPPGVGLERRGDSPGSSRRFSRAPCAPQREIFDHEGPPTHSNALKVIGRTCDHMPALGRRSATSSTGC
jgi:transposase